MNWLLRAILLLAIAVTSSKQQDSFYFFPQPEDKEVLVGASVELRCDVSNRDHIAFFWTLDNQRIQNSSRRFQEGSNLRILRVNREDDEGAYSCTAMNVTTGVSLRSKTARLTVIWISNVAEVQLKVPRQVGDIVQGEEVSLKCQCNGNPEPKVIWFKNRLRLDESEQVRFHKSRLKISAVQVEDNGVYSCQASNEGGQATSLTNFILNVPGTGGAELVTDTFTQYQLVKQGSSAYFNCEYTNAIMTEWYFGNTKLTNEGPGDKYILHDNGSLVIHEVQPRDSGGYSCLGLSAGNVQKFVAELLLAYLDSLDSEHLDPPPPPAGQPVVIPVNSKYRVKCILPSGQPIPTQRWESPQGAVLTAEGRVTAVDGQLSITGAQAQDSGNYSCVVSNSAAVRTIRLLLIVSEPPIISQHPQEVRVLEGEDASFTCSVSGTPYPVTRITWTKDDLPIDPLSSHYHMNEEHGILTIVGVRPSDHANYACVAASTGHKEAISFSRTLFVKKKLKFRPAPVDKKLELGELAQVHCRVDGDSPEQNPIQVHWHRLGQENLGSHVTDNSGVLTFEPVEKYHAGKYSCVAESLQGKINHSISVQVVVRPWFKVHPQNTTVYEGQSVMLHCVVEGDPKPNVRWDKNSHIEDFDKTRVNLLKNGSLFIKEALLEDIGRYGCTAGNSWGFLREEMYLTVKTGSPQDKFGMMKTIIIAVCSAVAYLAIVIGLTVYCSIRLVKMKNRGKNKRNTEEDANNTAKLENGSAPSERTELMEKKAELDLSVIKPVLSEDSRSHVSGLSSGTHSSQPSSQRSGQSFHKYAFPRHDLQTLGMLGKGFYGDVFLAKAQQIVPGEMETLVVVKSLLSRDETSHYEFRREMDVFSKMNHEHLVKLLGVCRDMEPQFLITEYCEWGDLKQFLCALRKDNGRTAQIQLPPLSLGQKVTMCIQVASGMEHLASHRFVHKDLAARNVLLAPNLDLKIATLGLCRDIYQNEYYLFNQRLVPLRWLAPEAALEDEYSTKSDVWAFGCFVWEVFSLGDLPQHHRGDEEVLQALHNGDCVLADRPASCPQELWDLVQRCTTHSPSNRPSFTEISTSLGDMTVDSDV